MAHLRNETLNELPNLVSLPDCRGKKNKKKYIFLFSLPVYCADGGLNLATKG